MKLAIRDAVVFVTFAMMTACTAAPVQGVATVPALRETAAVASGNDAADDPAIWADRSNPAQSRIIATDKKGGLYVYDLDGKVHQFVPAGRVNNVDLRDGFPFAEGAAPIVVASNRTAQTLSIYRFDPATRQLDPVRKADLPTGLDEVYGLCLYRSAKNEFHAIATSKHGRIKQWRLEEKGGTVTATEMRSFDMGSITEGCVADDAKGVLYLAQEDVALWRLPADPAFNATSAGSTPVAVDRIGPHLTADIEGLTIYARPDGTGYLIASSQGNSTYAVYDRGGDNAYLGSFAIGPGKGVDGTSGTDGIDVSAADFGPDFPGGLFVAQDDANTDPAEDQDFKLVPFATIEAAIKQAK